MARESRALRICCSIAVLLPAAVFASGEARAVSDPAADLERFVSTAESHLQAGDLEAAEGRYRDALFNAWLLMARLEMLERRLPEAGEALRNASAIAGQNRDALHAVALAQLNAGESARAVEILKELAEKPDRNPETLRNLATALASTGDSERAVRTLEEARAMAPDDPELAFAVAADLLWLHRVDAAEPLLSQLRTQRPMAKTRVLIGRAYRDAGELERARAELEAALQLDYSLGVARFNAKEFDKATEPLSRALAAQPDDAGLKRMLALAWLNTEAYEKAATLLEDDPERETDPSLQFAYGLALARSGRIAAAEAVLEDLRARHGESAELRDVLRQIRVRR